MARKSDAGDAHSHSHDDGVPIRSGRKSAGLPVYLIAVGGIGLFAAMLTGVGAWVLVGQGRSGGVGSGGGIAQVERSVVPEIIRGESTVGDLVEHFRKNGIEGEFTPNSEAFSGVKAIEQGLFLNEDFTIEFRIYRFDDASKAKSLEKTNGSKPKYYRSGKFVIEIDEGKDRLLPIFKKF